jgi:hypothetical protein
VESQSFFKQTAKIALSPHPKKTAWASAQKTLGLARGLHACRQQLPLQGMRLCRHAQGELRATSRAAFKRCATLVGQRPRQNSLGVQATRTTTVLRMALSYQSVAAHRATLGHLTATRAIRTVSVLAVFAMTVMRLLRTTFALQERQLVLEPIQ